MICNGCGNTKAYRCTSWHENGMMLECCDRCGTAKSVAMDDVFWDGKPEINLADDPVTGKPPVFGSRQEKARYLKKRGLVQVDGRNHGGLGYGQQSGAVDDWRPKIRETRKMVESMGRDVRRQKIWKMIKETQGR